MHCFHPLTVKLWPTFQKIASNSFLTKQGRETCVTQMFTRVAGFCPYQHLMAFIPKCSGCLGRVLACTARRSAVSYQNAWKFVIKTMKENLGRLFLQHVYSHL